ncbi:unnamed protein product [Phytophthora lilii]|uniref:Unnamed protein product n=1 Tax=Phytophthora lilii TaxID=2077276 RepID=A0A9W6UDI5_9STRA|nr:unnamed protein product [Phytophthora lilii]
MDEVAFVESLFAPEMRSAVAAPSHPPASLLATPPPSCGRVKALATAERSPVPAPPNSLLGGGIALSQLAAPFQPPSDDAPLFVRLQDGDDMFGQMLADQDFELHGFKKEAARPLLLEPLDLPRDQSLKDAFCIVAESPRSSPMHFQTFRAPAASAPMRGGICNVGNSSFMQDGPMMPVFPVNNGANGPAYFGGGGFSSFPPLSPATHAWMQNDVATPSSSNYQRVHTMKNMMTMASMGMSAPMMLQHQPSPGSVDMFNTAVSSAQPSTSGLWVSTDRNDLPEAPLTRDRKQGSMMRSLDAIKTSVERPPFSLTISPPASLTNRDVKALKELIVSADYGTPPAMSRPKRPRSLEDETVTQPKTKAARTTSASPVSQENISGRVNVKITKGKKCIEEGCIRRAQSNSRCKAHGGGARCQYAGPGGCNRSSQGGGFCRAHGGGKRCEFPGCTRGQQRKGRCYVHGGIRKCQYGSCEKKDRGNGFCISHGGGKRCEYPNCSRAVRRGLLCQVHESQNAAEKEAGESVAL